jgi:hypothetical protein
VNILIDYLCPIYDGYSYFGVLVGSSIAASCYLWLIFPHEITIMDTDLRNAGDEIERNLKRLFREDLKTPTHIIYRENLPELLTWNEARVEVSRLPDGWRVIGPKITLTWLLKQLPKQVG